MKLIERRWSRLREWIQYVITIRLNASADANRLVHTYFIVRSVCVTHSSSISLCISMPEPSVSVSNSTNYFRFEYFRLLKNYKPHAFKFFWRTAPGPSGLTCSVLSLSLSRSLFSYSQFRFWNTTAVLDSWYLVRVGRYGIAHDPFFCIYINVAFITNRLTKAFGFNRYRVTYILVETSCRYGTWFKKERLVEWIDADESEDLK